MRKRMLLYIAYLENLLKEDSDQTDWKKVYDDLLIQIAYFQHERLIHLIVTALFAIMEMICIAFVVTYQNLLFILAIALLVLLIPYIRHYYFLENRTQYLYTIYDKVKNKIE